MSFLDYGAQSVSYSGDRKTVKYIPVKWSEERVGKCPECGKRRKRSRTFEQTVSPFNKNKTTGLPKTHAEVQDSVQREGEAWVPDFTCSTH